MYVANNPINYVDPLGLASEINATLNPRIKLDRLNTAIDLPLKAKNDPIKDYLNASLRQIVLGNYTNDTTALGTTGQIILGIDTPADVRDILADVTNWNWSWSHVGQTTLDTIGLLPVVGGLKYTDKAGALVKGAGKTGIIEQHHLLPQQFKKQFEKAGLDIEKYKIPLDKADHRLKADGLHTGSNNWNKQWDNFFKQNPNARQDQILNQLDKMKKSSGLK